MEYTVIRSQRKTLGLEITPEGRVLVRAPQRTPQRQIDAFLRSHEDWIRKHLAKVAQAREAAGAVEPLTEAELQALAEQARSVIPARVAHYAPLVGVSYGRVSIRHQRTKWGSCSAAGNLNFNCLLMLTPPEVIDSVVVHELCHRKEMNHSPRFYAEVLRVFPDYHRWHSWLKAHGAEIMQRMGTQ